MTILDYFTYLGQPLDFYIEIYVLVIILGNTKSNYFYLGSYFTLYIRLQGFIYLIFTIYKKSIMGLGIS